MIGIALHMDHLGRDVFRFVADRIDQHSAAHRTIWTSGARLCGSRNLQLSNLRVCGSEIEAKQREAGTGQRRNLEEISTVCLHAVSHPCGVIRWCMPRE